MLRLEEKVDLGEFTEQVLASADSYLAREKERIAKIDEAVAKAGYPVIKDWPAAYRA